MKQKKKERVSKLVYDTRGTALRNLTRKVGGKVAMDAAGIKTRAILDRYNISSDLVPLTRKRRQRIKRSARSTRSVMTRSAWAAPTRPAAA